MSCGRRSPATQNTLAQWPHAAISLQPKNCSLGSEVEWFPPCDGQVSLLEKHRRTKPADLEARVGPATGHPPPLRTGPTPKARPSGSCPAKCGTKDCYRCAPASLVIANSRRHRRSAAFLAFSPLIKLGLCALTYPENPPPRPTVQGRPTAPVFRTLLLLSSSIPKPPIT
jgi:hypothetical protein